MARTYNRDSRGRFASGGSSSGSSRRKSAKLPAPTKRTTSGKVQRRGLLTQRSSLARSQAKLKAKDSADRSLTGQLSLRAQKAAVTRAKNKLAAAQKTGRVRLKARDGVVNVGGKKAAAAKPARTKQPIDVRLSRVKSKINAKAIAVKDELRKIDNAKNRDNSTSITPRWQKLMQREARAERAARSVMRASKAVRRIEMATTPEKFGYARGSQQRRDLAAQIRQQRRVVKYAAKAESQAKVKYESSPVVKYGLTSEIGGNRRQSRKAKSRASARQTSIVDDYVSAGMNTRKAREALSRLRATAKTQTSKTNAAKPRRR